MDDACVSVSLYVTWRRPLTSRCEGSVAFLEPSIFANVMIREGSLFQMAPVISQKCEDLHD